MKFSFFAKKKEKKDSFSEFFRHASKKEKEKVLREVAKKASEDQRELLRKYDEQLSHAR